VDLGTGPCTLTSTTGPRTFANCQTAPLDLRRELSLADFNTGRFIGFLDYFTDHGTSKYNGLLLSVQRRAANGISATANYTVSTCRSHPTQGGGTSNVGSGYMVPVSIITPPADAEARLDRDYGRCPDNRTHIFNATASVETPQFDSAALRAFASGWRLSGIFRAASGQSLNVTTGLDQALTGNPGQQRPNVSGDPYGERTLNNWFNNAAFSQPALGTFGNAERNGFEGPGSRVVDLSLVRSFRFAETHRIEARVEAFNAFNWFRLGAGANGNPVTNLNNANFGRILTAGEPRIMQFALKYQF
jgi:hypothetical protein